MPTDIAEIVLNIPLDKSFHYRVPPSLRDQIAVGKRVHVPFGKFSRAGWCIGFTETSEVVTLKDVERVLDERPIVDGTMLALSRWMADYYLCSWGEALEAVVPTGVKSGRSVRTLPAVELSDTGRSTDLGGFKPEKHRRILESMKDTSGPVLVRDLVKRCAVTAALIKTLIQKGLLLARAVRPEVDTFADMVQDYPKEVVLTPEQRDALARVETHLGQHQTLLLYGVTGSGKTEVYLKAIEKMVAAGKQSIVLVPEIALTPQTVTRFRSRFPRTAVLHSYLTEGDRTAQWNDIRSGQVDVVVGARSAVFAPVQNLGLIVIDEEHETSYKQPNSPRYHAREVAIRRAELSKALVILGTATPSIESYVAARSQRYELVSLPYRIEHRPMPEIEIVDMAAEMAAVKHYPVISRRLKQLVQESLSRQEQVILFQNRRGFTTYTTCSRCHWIMKCRRCDTALTFHKQSGRAQCHHCMENIPMPSTCPHCSSPGIKHLGIGTERIEEEIRMLFDGFQVSRMDSDSMKTRGDYRQTLSDLWSGETDVLVGTQITAKGLDVPNVTLVGVISADTAFHIPDFRSAERTFQLITQVAGRAGRGPKGGKVLVQTFQPDHYAIQGAARYDYDGFVRKECETRQPLSYPPYGHLVRLLFHGIDEKKVRETAEQWKGFLKTMLAEPEARLLGPSPAPLYRMKGQYRVHLMIKAIDLPIVLKVLRDLSVHHRPSGTMRLAIDVDPIDMM